MFRQFGYQRTENGDRFVLSENLPKVNLEVTAMCFRLASVMCLIIYFAQKRLPEASLSMVFEVAERTPIGENELIPFIKKQLLPKHKPTNSDDNNSTAKPEPKIIASPNLPLTEAMGAPTGKRDKEIPRGLTAAEEDTTTPHSTISLRYKSLDLNNFIVPTRHKQDEKVNKGARSKEFEFAFDEAAYPYGFSQPFGKGLSMRLSPGFDPIVDEEEDEDESNRSPFSKPVKDRLKGERNRRPVTFSTFKKQSSSNVISSAGRRDVLPRIHHQIQTVPQIKDDFDDDGSSFLETVSTQSKSEDSLENFFKTRKETSRYLGKFE